MAGGRGRVETQLAGTCVGKCVIGTQKRANPPRSECFSLANDLLNQSLTNETGWLVTCYSKNRIVCSTYNLPSTATRWCQG